ncbi:TetR/AcrR family transcriptional regulator [Hazenella coriacea]|uniref:TetR family transcriptional regulator n=1 Tax=Hazenella coriacea TaxID=1179467 RepID=A0A4R3L2U7_9BACL|nr:TetR/AcrR family transcriptional regulator [Hazenella coriacea]TCS93225.1 TetR family transcriptional regulator [Hazenella coriacea]
MLRETRKRELKEQIFLQAVQLFKERGYENVTVQQIASACGIAKGTFFNYFSKKEEILLYLGESQIELFNRSMERHQGIQHPKEQIERVLSDLLLRFTEHGELMKLAVLEIMKSAYLIENESKSILQLKQSIVAMIDHAKQNGKLSNHWNSEVIASTIVSIYFHTMMSWSLHDQNSKISDLFQQHLDVVWEGIGS